MCPPPLSVRTEWTFDDGTQGWTPDHDLAPFAVKNGVLICSPSGGDPYLCVRMADLDAERYDRVQIRCRSTEGGPLQVFWATAEAGFTATQCADAAVSGNEQWQNVEIDLSRSPTWRSRIIGFRIDPPPAGLEINTVRFLQK